MSRLVAALLALGMAAAVAPETGAQCVQNLSTVDCTGVDPDGFQAVDNDLTITVQDTALVQGDGTAPAILVGNNSDVIVEMGGTLTSMDRPAVAGTQGNTFTNRGDVVVTGPTVGVLLGTFGDFVNEDTGQLFASPGLVGSVAGVETGSGGSVDNAGLIQVTGTGSVGVFSRFNAPVVNTGTIRSLDTGGRGVVIGSGSPLDNSGSILATGTDGVGVRLIAQGIVTNSGDIQGGDGIGAGVLAAPGVASRFSNLATGTVSAASGVAYQGSNSGNVVDNAGIFDGDVLLGDGLDAFFWGTGSSVTGALDGGGGVDDRLVLFQSDQGNPVPGAFDVGSSTGFEFLEVGQPGETESWTLSGTGSYDDIRVISGNQALFADGLSLTGAVLVEVDSLGRFESGTSAFEAVSVDGAAVFGPDASVTIGTPDGNPDLTVTATGGLTADGTATLTGDLAFEGGSAYVALVDSVGNSRLDVQGSIDIAPGAGVVLLDGGVDPNTPLNRTVRILTSTDGINGEFLGFGSDSTSAFFGLTPIYGSAAGVSFLDVSIRSSFTAPASSPNEFRIGQHLDLALGLGPSQDFERFLASLLSITGTSAGAEALASLHPEPYDVHTSASLETGSTFARMLARRPLRCEQLVSSYRRDHPSLAPCGTRGITPWSQGFGRYARRNGDGGFDDWHYGGGGLAVGADAALGPAFLLSAMLGTSRMALDFDGDGDGSVTSLDLGLGAAWRHGNTHVRGVVEYGHGWHDTRRHIDIPFFEQVAVSSHESDRVTALVEVGHTVLLAPFEIEPLVSVEYTYLDEASVDEHDAGVASLDLDSRSNALVATNAGVRAGATLIKWYYMGTWLEWADGVWRPELLASWRQVWNDADRAVGGRLSGAPSDTPAFRIRTEDASWGADLGARVSFQPHGTRNTVELGYEAFVGDGNLSHTAMLRFRMPL